MADHTKHQGVSLAKGPVAIVGIALLAYGVLALILGGNGFKASPVDGTVQGTGFLGVEGNGWTNLLFIGAGALLLFGSPLHWGAKGLSLVVGLALGAASLISLVDGDDVFGIFAANGLTSLVWGIAAAVLLVLALLPRVGRRSQDDDDRVQRRDSSLRRERMVEPEASRFEREDSASDATGSRRAADGGVVSPASRPRQRDSR